MNAVERKPVPTRVLNPNASESSYKPEQCRRGTLLGGIYRGGTFRGLFSRGGVYLETLWMIKIPHIVATDDYQQKLLNISFITVRCETYPAEQYSNFPFEHFTKTVQLTFLFTVSTFNADFYSVVFTVNFLYFEE